MSNINFLISKQQELEGEIKPFDKNENNELAKKFHSLSPEKQELFLLNNCRLVYSEAYRYCNTNNTLLDELISVGILGLQKAIKNYDANNKASFGTYATICIRNEIFMFLRKMKRYQGNIELDAPMLDNELEDLTKLDSIQLLLGINDTESNLIHDIYTQDVLENITVLIDELSERDYFILMHTYGIGDYEKMTQLDISNELSLSQSYISRRTKTIVKKLTKTLAKNGFYVPE